MGMRHSLLGMTAGWHLHEDKDSLAEGEVGEGSLGQQLRGPVALRVSARLATEETCP